VKAAAMCQHVLSNGRTTMTEANVRAELATALIELGELTSFWVEHDIIDPYDGSNHARSPMIHEEILHIREVMMALLDFTEADLSAAAESRRRAERLATAEGPEGAPPPRG